MTTVRTPFSRVFTLEDRAGPVAIPTYQGVARAMGPSWSFGDTTPVREPDSTRYGAFKIVDSIRGEQGLPTLSLENRYAYTVSEFLRMGRRGCPLDVQVHMGVCQDPRDFNGGWDKVLVLEGASLVNWGTGEMGALEQGQDAVVNENIDFSALDLYEIKRLLLRELATTEIISEIVDVVICDAVSCGACGIPSEGCDKVFAIDIGHPASPGLAAELIYSGDGGTTISETNITSLPPNTAPSAIACVGIYLVVVSNADCSIHYAPIADILNDAETWTETVVGLVCPAGAPNDLFSLGSGFTWIVGQAGYVYFSSDITAGVSVQDAGVATTQNLNAIHGVDEDNLVAVGVLNAVIHTIDGVNWTAVLGPAPGVTLNTVWMRSTVEWFVGTATGRLYYTRDSGDNWTEKTFPGSGTGSVRDIVFATPTVGYLAHNTVAPAGRVLRSIDGGSSWYVLPEGTGSIPTNDYVGALAATGACPNVFFGGGLAANAVDGFFVKGS